MTCPKCDSENCLVTIKKDGSAYVVRCYDCGCEKGTSDEIKFRVITSRSKEDLEEILDDFYCLGVRKQQIEEIEGELLVTFDREEWVNSWRSVGFEPADHAKAFEEELKGQDFEATVLEVSS